MRKVSAMYAVVMGVSLIGTWIVLLATGKAINPADTPLQTWSLLTAEFLTGTLLILGGWGMLVRRRRGFALHLVSLGMLLYVSIFSIGVFNGSPASAFFIVVALATAAVVVAEIARADPELTSRPRVTE